MNNNNVNNRYVGCGVSELPEDILLNVLQAERDCFKNKHQSFDACKIHYHLALVVKLATELYKGTWEQGKSIVFPIAYPTIREVWAADYPDRILHHLVAPILVNATEKVHIKNGNVSHGNRTGFSAHTAAIQIQLNMQRFVNGYIGKRDLSGFFMSIPRQRAYQDMENAIGNNLYIPLIRKLILHNPTTNFRAKGDLSLLDRVPRNKSLHYARDGCGIPIGNYYCQLTANLYPKEVDALALSPEWRGKVGYTRFVDDMCVIADNQQTINKFFDCAEEIYNIKGITMHPNKRYLQPIRHGVSFCGRTIHNHGIYINNRTIRACKNSIKSKRDGLDGARDAIKSLNSYFGFMKYCKAFRIQQRIAEYVRKRWGEYITQELRRGQIVFKIAPQYKAKTIAYHSIKQYQKQIKQTYYDFRKKGRGANAACRGRERQRGRR